MGFRCDGFYNWLHLKSAVLTSKAYKVLTCIDSQKGKREGCTSLSSHPIYHIENVGCRITSRSLASPRTLVGGGLSKSGPKWTRS